MSTVFRHVYEHLSMNTKASLSLVHMFRTRAIASLVLRKEAVVPFSFVDWVVWENNESMCHALSEGVNIKRGD